MISGSEDGMVKYWNLTNGRYINLEKYYDYVYTVTMNENATIGVSSAGASQVVVWNLTDFTPIHNFTKSSTAYFSVITHDSEKLAIGYSNYNIYVWNIKTG